jgi:TPR repeat protein
VRKDPVQAATGYRRAADQGDAKAQYGMGFCYQHALGVCKDDTLAQSWYQKAAFLGNAEAKKELAPGTTLAMINASGGSQVAAAPFKQPAYENHTLLQIELVGAIIVLLMCVRLMIKTSRGNKEE